MNVMLDLETLGTRPGSVIVSIGAVAFDLDGLHDEFAIGIDIADAQREGLTICGDTVRWWMGKSPEARTVFSSAGAPLHTALAAFSQWFSTVPSFPKVQIWGNGASFDLSLLGEAYTRMGMARPWRYQDERCHRTLVALRPDIPWVRPEVAHQALSDARAQAEHAAKILAAISNPDEHRARTQLTTLAQALGVEASSANAHDQALHRAIHLAAREAT